MRWYLNYLEENTYKLKRLTYGVSYDDLLDDHSGFLWDKMKLLKKMTLMVYIT